MLTELNVPLEPTVTLYSLIGDGGIIFLALLGLAIPLWLRLAMRKISRNG